VNNLQTINQLVTKSHL